mmetsp:Transcript_37678/g.64263  ORF Transcript_37678/g.64263 Transcript_37678/m.64263 type:complete len:216 (-) Transcript_37678:542-1189(-)
MSGLLSTRRSMTVPNTLTSTPVEPTPSSSMLERTPRRTSSPSTPPRPPKCLTSSMSETWTPAPSPRRTPSRSVSAKRPDARSPWTPSTNKPTSSKRRLSSPVIPSSLTSPSNPPSTSSASPLESTSSSPLMSREKWSCADTHPSHPIMTLDVSSLSSRRILRASVSPWEERCRNTLTHSRSVTQSTCVVPWENSTTMATESSSRSMRSAMRLTST